MKELFLRSFAAIFRCYHLSPFLPLVTVFRRLSSVLGVCHQLLHIFEHLQPFLRFVAFCLHWSPFVTICYRSQTEWIDSVQLERSTLEEGTVDLGWTGLVGNFRFHSTTPVFNRSVSGYFSQS